MPTIFIDGKPVKCREGTNVLQAALEAGWDVPHYCYHPGLKVVASCRLCLMEMKVANPKTGELEWSPRLVPSCQTPVRDRMEVRVDSEKVRANREACMEYYLLNHPLDCPVCDQAGECYLQDYSLRFGQATSRMVDEKHKSPKKDIGPRTLLYQDRCVLCTRCVRFAAEISGTSELCIVNRGALAEIDVFPGMVLDNKLQGNVVDLCPVGALLDKEFLMAQRVWFLGGTPSVCPGCSTGCSIRIDHNAGRIWRLKPRYNPQVNQWWICDEGRFGWKYVHDERRITQPILRRGTARSEGRWEEIIDTVPYRLQQLVARHGEGILAGIFSPLMSCEEAWLLGGVLRQADPQAALALGPIPSVSEDEHFPVGCSPQDAQFTIHAEKCPNRRGVQMVLDHFGDAVELAPLLQRCTKGEVRGLWVVGGYPGEWVTKEIEAAAAKVEFLIVQDMFASKLSDSATLLLPACGWAEREGSFVNHAGLLQTFERAINPPDGARSDGQVLYAIAGMEGLYTGRRVGEMMAAVIPEFAEVYTPPAKPVHQH